MLRWILGGLAVLVLVLVVLFLWPGWGAKSDGKGEEPKPPVAQTEPAPAPPAEPSPPTSAAAKERCEALRAQCVEVLKDEDRCATLAADCEQMLVACPECPQAGPPAEVAKCLEKCKERCAAQAKAGKGKGGKKGGSGPAHGGGGSSGDKPKGLAGAPQVKKVGDTIEVGDGFSQVVFFGPYGSPCPLKVVGVSDGKATIPDGMESQCTWFNLKTEDGKWGLVTGGSTGEGVCAVKETSGPATGAHAFSWTCS